MSNINALPLEYFSSFADEVTGKFRRLQRLVSHAPSTGDYHEEIVRTVLRNFLSARYSVLKGFIFADTQHVSRQLDVMIVDENVPSAYVFKEGEFALVLPRAVVAVIEVKTSLDAGAFDEGLMNIASAKEISAPGQVTGIVFGFSGTTPNDNVLGRWFKRPTPSAFLGRESKAPDAFMFLESATLLVRCNNMKKVAPEGTCYRRITDGDDQIGGADNLKSAYQLSVVLAMILKSCERKQFFDFPQGDRVYDTKLVQAERGRIEAASFAFGAGKTTD